MGGSYFNLHGSAASAVLSVNGIAFGKKLRHVFRSLRYFSGASGSVNNDHLAFVGINKFFEKHHMTADLCEDVSLPDIIEAINDACISGNIPGGDLLGQPPADGQQAGAIHPDGVAAAISRLIFGNIARIFAVSDSGFKFFDG